jgi:toxin ParE1/3/4
VKPLYKRSQVIVDLADICAWIGEQNLDSAEQFLAAVARTLEQIQQHPNLGWSRPWHDPRLYGLRSWRVEDFANFLVFYREEESSIEIYAVLRAARHLERALRRR